MIIFVQNNNHQQDKVIKFKISSWLEKKILISTAAATKDTVFVTQHEFGHPWYMPSPQG